MSPTRNETKSTDEERHQKSLSGKFRRIISADALGAGWLLSRSRIYDFRLLLPRLDILLGRWPAPDDSHTRRNRSHFCRSIPGCTRALIPQHRDLPRVRAVAAFL